MGVETWEGKRLGDNPHHISTQWETQTRGVYTYTLHVGAKLPPLYAAYQSAYDAMARLPLQPSLLFQYSYVLDGVSNNGFLTVLMSIEEPILRVEFAFPQLVLDCKKIWLVTIVGSTLLRSEELML